MSEELRIHALGAAISRRDWNAVERAHAEIRDTFHARQLAERAVLEFTREVVFGDQDRAALRKRFGQILTPAIDSPAINPAMLEMLIQAVEERFKHLAVLLAAEQRLKEEWISEYVKLRDEQAKRNVA